MRLGRCKIIVDVERGRTVKDWLPRRLGGGLTRKAYSLYPPANSGTSSNIRDSRDQGRGYGGDRASGGGRKRYERSPRSARSRSPKRREDYYRR
jgi:U1 small nuclear ribonucleoprotein 70kDa